MSFSSRNNTAQASSPSAPVPMQSGDIATALRCELTELLTDQCAHCLKIPDLNATSPGRAGTSARAKSLALHVEDLMLIMNTNFERIAHRGPGGRLPLSYYDRAEPYSLLDATHADVLGDTEYFLDASPSDLAEPLDVVVANTVTDGGLVGETYAIRRFRKVRRPYLPTDRLARCIVEAGYLAINAEAGQVASSVRYFGTNVGGGSHDSWFELKPRGYREIKRGEVRDYGHEQFLIQLAMGIQLARDYQWRVHLKSPGADIGVTIPTTPVGVRALFKLRDCESGESRRKALVHWVSGHHRRVASRSEDDLAWVRDHLRGKTTFKWQDLQGSIYPSTYDLRRLKEMRHAAKAVRKASK